MTNEEYSKIITEIETLPTGGITYKKINGKEYAYYQWREDGQPWHYATTNGMGGAVFIVGNNTKVINCNFDNNTATNGSAVYILGINTTVVNTTFTNNTTIVRDANDAVVSSSDGGAIYNKMSLVEFASGKKATFDGNSATNGGAIYNDSYAGLTAPAIINFSGTSEFKNNTALSDGFPSLFKKLPGIFPTAYSFSS